MQPLLYPPPPDPNDDLPPHVELEPIQRSSEDMANSPYAHFWATPNAYDPDVFYDNTTPPTEYRDVVWGIVFIIHFLAVACIFIYALTQIYNDEFVKIMGSVASIFKLPVIAGMIATFLHLAYIFAVPVFYIKFSAIVTLIMEILVTLLALPTGFMAPLAVVQCLVSVVWWCYSYKRANFSGLLLKYSLRIFKNHPTIILVSFLQTVTQVLVSIMYIVIGALMYLKGLEALFIPLAVSFIWTYETIHYVSYMTTAGLAASWYFLEGTEYPYSCWDSFKRASTSSFGTAAFAAGILALIKGLQMALNSARQRQNQNNNNNRNVDCGTVMMCLADCILKCAEDVLLFLTRYGLLYCATFGVPFSEGCRRFVTLRAQSFIDVLVNSDLCGTAITLHSIAFSFLGMGIAYLFDKDTAWIGIVITPLIQWIVMNHLSTSSDALMICYSEKPEILHDKCPELYDVFGTYQPPDQTPTTA